MINGNYEITIIGLGNIGLRYLEGILKIDVIRKINLIEKNLKFLNSKLLNYAFNGCQIYKNEFITEEILCSDLIIVSTSSNERYEICKKLKNLGYFGDLILEKFLFPNFEILEKGENLFNNYPSNIYVNQWMRKTHFSDIFNKENITKVEIEGNNLGLLCNAVHFIDLIKEKLQIKDFTIDSKKSIIKNLIKAKRKGYQEIRGKLVWTSSIKNLVFSLEDKVLGTDDRDIKFLIQSNSGNCRYFFSGQNLIKLGSNKKYYIPYLSEHSTDTIFKILGKKDPLIPSFEISVDHHKLLLNSLNILMKPIDYKKIRIT